MRVSRPVARRLGPRLVLAGAAGWLVARCWTGLGLPAQGAAGDAPFPGLWAGVFAVGLAASFAAFTLLHEWLRHVAPPGADAGVRRAAWWDGASYALLPLFLVAMLAGHATGAWRWLLPATLVAIVAGKTALAVTAIYRALVLAGPTTAEAADPPALGPCLFAVALLPAALLAPYVAVAVSTGGDEPGYLLNVESLRADGDLDVRNNVPQGDAAGFYWGPPPSEPWSRTFPGFAALLLPGYSLGRAVLPHYPLAGRLGAMLTITIAAAMLAWQAYGLCRDLGASRPAAFWTWLLVGFTAPVLVHSTHVYPEVPAALLATVGTRAVLRIPRGAGPALLVAVSAAALLLLKDRYAPVALGLLVWALLRWAARRPALAACALATVLIATAAILWADPAPALFPNLGRLPPMPSWDAAVRSGLGLLADQEFGLLYYAPQWALALVGIPLLWRRHRHACLALLGITAFYLIVLVRYRWVRWFGGWTPSPRFVLACTALWAPFLAAAFDGCRSRAFATLHGAGLVWTTLVACSLFVVPAWRYDDADGRARLLEALGAQLGLDLARFLPSLVAPTAWTWTALSLVAAGGGLLLWRRWRAPAVTGPPRSDWLSPRPAALLAAGTALAWLALAALVPTWSLEGEALERSTGGTFQSLDYGEIGWVAVGDGWIAERIVTWPGWTEIRVTAGAYTTTAEAPRLRVSLDGQPVGDRPLRAVPGYWVRGDYVTRIATRFGRPLLRVELTGLADDPAGPRFQHAYVDRIRLGRLDEAGRRRPAQDCATDPLRHCPDAPVSRAELAGLLVGARPRQGSGGETGGDGDPVTPIESLVAQGIMTPCDPEPLCAEGAVSRRELAPILFRALHGRDFVPPAVPPRFRDVLADDPLAPWVEALGAQGLTCGCGPRSYCPEAAVTWRQIVQLLGRAFPGSHPPAPCSRPP